MYYKYADDIYKSRSMKEKLKETVFWKELLHSFI